ncbi:hypothetical protein [Alishewanella sp. HL-SH05]|uniref:hypothetical protein n=1 Tax=Alishewanella sp. HL-SH05 TaxID=3461145 RepID=UPI004041E7A4
MANTKTPTFKNYADFTAHLASAATLIHLPLSQLQLSKVTEQLLLSANVVTLYKSNSNSSALSVGALRAQAIQNPIIAMKAKYSSKKKPRFDIFGGVITYQRLLSAHLDKNCSFPVLVVNNSLPEEYIKLFTLHDFTRLFLHDAHITEFKTVMRYLEAWIEKPKGANSIFQSQEWLTLYPELTSKAKVASWLNVTNKRFVSNGDK